ncbi:hypothetical protein BC830DRAFT_1157926, partial [Chytriomyces sp. MP71]
MDPRINRSVLAAVRAQKTAIKNRGSLNAGFAYFGAGGSDDFDTLRAQTGRSDVLSDTAAAKFFTVAADTILFSATLGHVLLVFRCPHDHASNRTCADNVLDSASFQYKGCLATPGGFFEHKADLDPSTGDPDFAQTATRELNEECADILGTTSVLRPRFLGAQFNNLRDIRWLTSTNYVPTCATQFATALLHDPTRSNHQLPYVAGTDDACGNAYWVDTRILENVYARHKETYDAFDDAAAYTDERLHAFVSNEAHFVLDPATRMPRNKLREENRLLATIPKNQFVVEYDPAMEYHFSDFAFDHVRNVVRAKEALKEAIRLGEI